MALNPEVRLERFLAGQNLTPAVRLEYFLAGAAGYGLAALQDEAAAIAAGGTAVATIPDAADNVPLQSLLVQVDPLQEGSGTPAPDNERPILPRESVTAYQNSKNLLHKPTINSTISGINAASNADGSIVVNGTATALADIKIAGATTDTALPAIMTTGGSTFKYNGGVTGLNGESGNTLYVAIKNSSNVTRYVGNNSSAFTSVSLAADEFVDYMFIRTANGTTANNVVLYPMVVTASTMETAFEEYNETVYNAKLPAGFYGGTVDVVKGVAYKLYKKIVLDGSSDPDGVSGSCGYYNISDMKNSASQSEVYCYCDSFEPASWVSVSSAAGYQVAAYKNSGWAVGRIAFNMTNTAADLRDYLAEHPVTVLYEATSPEELNIDPVTILTLKGVNNFSADTGNVLALEYKQDPEASANEIKALIAPVLPEMKADANLTANDFRIVGNTLYKITASIAAGGTLTPGSNCTATTVGAQLKALL